MYLLLQILDVFDFDVIIEARVNGGSPQRARPESTKQVNGPSTTCRRLNSLRGSGNSWFLLDFGRHGRGGEVGAARQTSTIQHRAHRCPNVSE